ncbi:phage tail spike protein [Enterococcus devriesei]|uniref:phage tail spike protein n=1 Tax=Enterococcus devriesei TaxID=319970 RepID=UPI0036D2A57A
MSSIILHDKTNNDWNSLGFGPLVDAINPKVTREKHGVYDLQFQYPVTGPLFKEIKNGRWVVSDAGPTIVSQAQRFEIVTVTKPIDGIVTVFCEHKRYQLLRSIVKIGEKMTTTKAQLALNTLSRLSEPQGDFTFYSDVQTTAGMDFSDPSKFDSVQSALGGVRGSILDNFGGEYLFNNNEVKLLQSAGKESNVIIAYGKNLTDITQEESIENTFTSIYGWSTNAEGQVITLPETYIDSEYVNNYTQRRIQIKDFSEDNVENVSQLRAAVQNFIKNNNVGIPKISIKSKYEDLASSAADQESIKLLESVDLCDYVTVTFNQLEINTSAQIVKTVWNVSLDKYDSVELGDARTDFAKIIEDNKTDTGAIEDKLGWLEDAQQEASDILNNPGKGNVVIYPSLADPQEISIMDTKDINTAKNVWKWNAGGLGFSSTGYNGTYELAMTNNGAIVADRMTTGTLRAINIVGVTITGAVFTAEDDDFKQTIKNGHFTWVRKKDSKVAMDQYMTIYNSKPVNIFDMTSGGGFIVEGTGGNNEYADTRLLSIFGSDAGAKSSFTTNTGEWNLNGGDTGNTNKGTLNYYNDRIEAWLQKGSSNFVSMTMRDKTITVIGNWNVAGTKNSLSRTENYGERLLYAFETPEYLFATYGKATTNGDGYVQVEIEPMFLETINTDSKNYHVFVSPYDNSTAYACYLERDRFMIKSDKPNIEVSYQLVAYRLGYEDFYLETPTTNEEKSPDVVQYPLKTGDIISYEEGDNVK